MVTQNRELRQRLQKAVYGDAEQWRGNHPSGNVERILARRLCAGFGHRREQWRGETFTRACSITISFARRANESGTVLPLDNKLIFRPPGYTDPTTTIGPALIDAPFTPTKTIWIQKSPTKSRTNWLNCSPNAQGKINALNESGR